MFETLKIGAWACIDGRCPVRPLLHLEDQAVTLIFGDRDTFEVYLDSPALQNIIELATVALNELTGHTST
ncbi:hypothetical protein IU459_14650 [Nocardia amamiensis]|uniref:Uncharacterized protein n=1 Tax=Nocardia amamiensis TaxID=404578 RepID=A0ABS0CSJ6_9NOCA|nr:hypothetical protein [Nocardia amamiensis]MBF6298772.1 hypothetical protein [Nocardia amamiensis]